MANKTNKNKSERSHFIHDVDPSWTLFLDRDGVINKNHEKGYVENVGEFEFLNGVLEALYRLDEKFYKIIVVTNQQAIGRGYLSTDSIDHIHNYMLYEVQNAHGRIDEVYYCGHMPHEESFFRKPNPGMALQAKKDFPLIDFNKSIMIGDSITDIHFGHRLGMKVVYVGNKNLAFTDSLVDMYVPSLLDFSLLLHSRYNKF